MAILGTLVDLQTISIAGGASDGVEISRLNHSLPATTPELIIPAMQSCEAVGANGANGVPALLGLGGNESFVTFGYAMASSPSVPTVQFELACIVFHSIIR